MIDERALRKAFSDYADALLGQYRIGDVLYRLTDQVVEVLGIEGAGVSLLHPKDGLRFVTSSGEGVTRVEREQVQEKQGPCHSAASEGRIVTSRDLRDDDRWPDYADVAIGCGYLAVAGIPMAVGGRSVGAVNLYAARPRVWDERELEVAQLLANVATGYILHIDALERSRTLGEQLERALDSRVIIEQAKGIVAERHGIDVSDAFERLRKHSRSTSTKLHDVCGQVVAGELDV